MYIQKMETGSYIPLSYSDRNTVLYTIIIKEWHQSSQVPYQSVCEVCNILFLLNNSLLILPGHYQLKLYAFLSLLAVRNLSPSPASEKSKRR